MIKKEGLRLKILMIFSALFWTSAQAITFHQATRAIEKHESVELIIHKSRASFEEAFIKGSWGDPQFKVMAKNFPRDTLDQNQTPMTGIEFGLWQKIALTRKYKNLKESSKSLSRAYAYEANDKKQTLIKALWEVLILKRKISEELTILNENKKWISRILKVSKKLYANGKTSQQAILDIQMRKSEIESEMSNKNFELSQTNNQIKYLTGHSHIEQKSIPWKILKNASLKSLDHRELSLREKLKSKEYHLMASKLNYIPDLTLSLGLTKRSDRFDSHGDFVGASISFPLPLSQTSYSKHEKAIEEKYVAIKNYENYKKIKEKNISILKKEIKKITHEMNILKNKTIKFAVNSRSITSKSYGLGSSSYFELLQSELRLQKILMHKTMLKAQRDIKKIALKYIRGENLNESFN